MKHRTFRSVLVSSHLFLTGTLPALMPALLKGAVTLVGLAIAFFGLGLTLVSRDLENYGIDIADFLGIFMVASGGIIIIAVHQDTLMKFHRSAMERVHPGPEVDGTYVDR